MTISDERLQGLIELFYGTFSRGNFSRDVRDTIAALRELQYRRAQPSAPEGWVMVPEEPTPEMCDAGMTNGDGIGSMYRAMLAARPLPPAPTAEEPVDDLQSKIDTAKAKVGAMSPEEREAMYRAQRESFARGMSPCEHGVADWEDCQDCRARAIRTRGE